MAGRTRSGATFRALPITTPTTFQLGALLEHAIRFENDYQCFDVDDVTGLPFQNTLLGRLDGVEGSSAVVGGGEMISEEVLKEDCVSFEEGEVIEASAGRLGYDIDESNVVESKGGPSRVQRHRKKRQNAWFSLHGQRPKPKSIEKNVSSSRKVAVDVELPALPFTSCGYHGKNVTKNTAIDTTVYTLDELKELGYTVVKHVHGVSQPLIDSNTGKVFAVVVGTVDDADYIESTKKAFEFLEECSNDVIFASDAKSQRRGSHPAVNYGVSYGQGSQEAHWLDCDHEELMQKILTNEHIGRLMTFASCAFSLWAPNVYRYYFTKLGELVDKFKHLAWPYYRTVWPCVTVNFGPIVCCKPHRDNLNLPFGWCAIQALGKFDYVLGGHLVLQDLRLAVEFPPGSLIFIPSALLIHSNTPVQAWERRISITQFCSGGLFRFIDNGFQTEPELKRRDKKRFEEVMKEKSGRRDMGIGLWSTLSELIKSNDVAYFHNTSQ